MDQSIAELKSQYLDIEASEVEVATVTPEQIALIGGGQCTTNSI